jgi:hypothetical protein
MALPNIEKPVIQQEPAEWPALAVYVK